MSPRDAERDETAELLSRTLAQEAAMVDPSPGGLQAIQRRTGTQHTEKRTQQRSPARSRWVVGALGAGLATAAVITTVVLVGGNGPGTSTTPPANPGAVQKSETLYYVGPLPADEFGAPRLYAEPHPVAVTDGADRVAALHEFLTAEPFDPDYSSGWPAGVDVSGITESDGLTTIALTGDADIGTSPLPGPPDAGREVAVQALLRTAGVQGSATFTVNGAPTNLVLYTSLPVSSQSDDNTRAWISIDNIVEGQTVTSPVTVQVSGNVFEGNVNWTLADESGAKANEGFATTAQGSWRQADIELGDLDPGSYTFTALERSAKDGGVINADDKTFTVE